MTIQIHWDPIPHLGPIPVNWYGLTFALGILVGSRVVLRRAPRFDVSKERVEELLIWIVVGTIAGARLYFIAQNDFLEYLQQPWRILAVWEGGLAFFGGLAGATLAAFLYSRFRGLSFACLADLVAPAIPIGGAIGRTSCGLDGMDYGTPTQLPWGVLYTHPDSYAPIDGISRHPTQFYELTGDLLIAAILLGVRGKLREGDLFRLYLVLFSLLRFLLFFVRGDVPVIALGLKNGQWTALAFFVLALSSFAIRRTGKTVPRLTDS